MAAPTSASINARIPGVVLGASTVPTSTQVDAMFTSLQKKYYILTGTAWATSDFADELLLLMGIVQLAEAYPVISGMASSLGQGSGTYTFNQEMVNQWKREIKDIISVNFADADGDEIETVNALDSAGYDDR